MVQHCDGHFASKMNKVTAVWAVSTLRKTVGTEVKNILTVYGNLIPNVIDSAALLTYLKSTYRRTLEPHRVSAYAPLYSPRLDPVNNISANQG